MIVARIFNADVRLCHGRQSNERTNLNHIGQHAVFATLRVVIDVCGTRGYNRGALLAGHVLCVFKIFSNC